MLTLVATILTASNSVGKPWRPQFEASCQRHAVPLVPLRFKDFNPVQGNLKLKALATACIERRSTHTHVLFLDGFDSILLDDVSEIERRFLEFNRPMVVAGASVLVPKIPSLFPYPLSESGSPFMYPRANIFMSEIPHFLQLLSQYPVHDVRGPFIDNEWFQHVYSGKPTAFIVDSETRLFITLDGASADMFSVDDGRVINNVNGNRPSVIHAAGTFKFAGVLQKLVSQGHYYLGSFKPDTRTVTPAYSDPDPTRMRVKVPVARAWMYDYAAAWKPRVHAEALQGPNRKVQRRLDQLKHGSVVVDFGAGTGAYTGLLSARFDKVVAVDVDKTALDQLRLKFPTVRLEVLPGPQISAVHDGTADFILAWDVLSFVDFYDLSSVLGEFNRMLSNGGQLLANFCDLRSPHNSALLGSDSPSSCCARLRPYTKDLLRLVFAKRDLTITGMVDEDGSIVVTARKRTVAPQTPQLTVRNFYHSGDAGDIIYALPTIKALGGGRLYLGPAVNIKYETATRLRMTEKAFENISELVSAQPYIHSCCFADVYPDGIIDYNLNEFRIWLVDHQTGNYWNDPDFKGTLSLAKVHLTTFGVDRVDETEPWLTVPTKAELPEGCDVVVARSRRYNNLRFPWLQLVKSYGHRMCFVGHDDEFAEFTAVAGKVEIKRARTSSLFELAQVIASARLFIGNQSCPFAIAEGLKLPAVQETWDHDPNCMFNRPTALYQCDDYSTIEHFMAQFLDV